MGATKEGAAATRQRLLETAIKTLRVRGANGLTLDLVAKESGVSKGGLLHHFPSKNALLEAILRYLIEDFETRAVAYYDQEPQRSGRWVRAYIHAAFDESGDNSILPLELIALLFTAVTELPALQTLINDDTQRWHERLTSDGLPPARAVLIRYAADAHWLDCTLAPAFHDVEIQRALVAELLQLSEVAPA